MRREGFLCVQPSWQGSICIAAWGAPRARSQWGRTCSASSDATSLTAAAAADAIEATLSVNFRKKLILGRGEVAGDNGPL